MQSFKLDYPVQNISVTNCISIDPEYLGICWDAFMDKPKRKHGEKGYAHGRVILASALYSDII